jgi:hypothetical protein
MVPGLLNRVQLSISPVVVGNISAGYWQLDTEGEEQEPA